MKQKIRLIEYAIDTMIRSDQKDEKETPRNVKVILNVDTVLSQMGVQSEVSQNEEIEMFGRVIIDRVLDQISWADFPWLEVKYSKNKIRFTIGPGVLFESDWNNVLEVFTSCITLYDSNCNMLISDGFLSDD